MKVISGKGGDKTMELDNLWRKVGDGCLDKALELLNEKNAPTAATARAVRELVETAISIDLLNLRWEIENRCGVLASTGQAFLRKQAKG